MSASYDSCVTRHSTIIADNMLAVSYSLRYIYVVYGEFPPNNLKSMASRLCMRFHDMYSHP
jgi:hypothetical protein